VGTSSSPIFKGFPLFKKIYIKKKKNPNAIIYLQYAVIFSSGQIPAVSSSNQEAASSTPNGAHENTEADTTCSPRNLYDDYASSEDEDVCPTCLEGNHFFDLVP
jgi:hypothetical protein